MDWLQQLDLEKFLLFTLVFVRVSGLVMTAPIYGTNDVPVRVRALFAFALAVLITPSQWDVHVEYPGSIFNYMVFIGAELVVGLVLGMGINILFSGIQIAGQLIGRIGGLMMADVYDPGSGTSVPLFSRMLFLVAMAVFVCIGGHRMVMSALLDTFQTIPPGANAVSALLTVGEYDGSLAESFTELMTLSFSLGIRASAPIVTAILLSTLVLGLVSRTLPQLNVLAIGFGLNSLLAFATTSVAVGSLIWVFQAEIEPTLELILNAIHLPLV